MKKYLFVGTFMVMAAFPVLAKAGCYITSDGDYVCNNNGTGSTPTPPPSPAPTPPPPAEPTPIPTPPPAPLPKPFPPKFPCSPGMHCHIP